MTSVKVKFRPSANPEKEGMLYYQVIHDRSVRQIPTAYRIRQTEWSKEQKTLTCRNGSERMHYILKVRERIKTDVERISRVIRKIEKSNLTYTADDIIRQYAQLLEDSSLFKYMDCIIGKLKGQGKVRTAESYRTALNSFKNFRNGEDILLEFLDRDILETYESWQRQRGIVPNTISFYIRILRAVYNRAVEEGLTENRQPFRKVYTGVEKTVKRALSFSDIKKIKDIDLSKEPEMDHARDMFILSFMLRGMSFVDMAYLKKTDLANGNVTYRRRKTGQMLTIEWTSDMQRILDKYPVDDTIYLLPIIRNPESVPLYAYRNSSHKINRRLKDIGARLEIPIPLTMYVARHSWASAARTKGIPISVISEGLGHDSELTTRIYLASLDTTVVDRANSLLIDELCS